MLPKQKLAVQLIAKWEGCKLEAYLDQGGVATIGIGTITYPNGKKVKIGEKITREQAEDFCNSHLKKFIYPLLDQYNLPDNVYAALASFCYNCGTKWVQQPDFQECITRQDYTGLSDLVKKFNKVKDRDTGIRVVNKGLTNRRNDEVRLMTEREDA